jgi:hypothetical protein
MLVLQLNQGEYYVSPRDSLSNFGVVGLPWLASDFAFKNEEVLSEVRKYFKGARYIRVKVTYEIIDEG